MCGIAGFYLKQPDKCSDLDLNVLLDSLLRDIEQRGGDATGFVAITGDGAQEWQKASCAAGDFITHRRPVPKGTTVVLAHTRWATQGHHAFPENNHPIKRGPFYIVHNGHINNDRELFAASGRARYGDVDSEAIAACIAEAGSLDKAGGVLAAIEGSAAVGFADERDSRALTVGKAYGSPLFVLETRRIVIFGSTEESVIRAHEKVIGPVKNKQVIEARTGQLFHWRNRTRTVETFVAYSPPAYTYTPSLNVGDRWGWKYEGDNNPQTAIAATSDSPTWAVDYCDCCEEEVGIDGLHAINLRGGNYSNLICKRCENDEEMLEAFTDYVQDGGPHPASNDNDLDPFSDSWLERRATIWEDEQIMDGLNAVAAQSDSGTQ